MGDDRLPSMLIGSYTVSSTPSLYGTELFLAAKRSVIFAFKAVLHFVRPRDPLLLLLWVQKSDFVANNGSPGRQHRKTADFLKIAAPVSANLVLIT